MRPIYTLSFHPKKNLSDYRRGIKKACFAKAQLVQLDWFTFSKDFFNTLIDDLRNSAVDISIRCTPNEVPQVISHLEMPYDLHIYFSHSSEILEKIPTLKNLQVPHKYVLLGKRSTDFLKIARIFSETPLKNLYFCFPTFSNKNPDSLRTREVAKIIRLVERKFPDLKVKPLPGLELFDENIKGDLDLEPLLDSANVELSVPNSQIEFSFIIPTYNSKYFLENVVAHIFRQDFPLQKFEVLVIDDGSTDNSMLHLESYLESEHVEGNLRYFYWPKPAVRPHEKPIFRAGLCRNLGTNNAKGKFLIFLDSDILVPKNFLLDLNKCFECHDVIQYVRHHILPEKSNSYVTADTLNLKRDLYIEEETYWGPYFRHPKWSDMDFFWKYTCTYCLAVKREDFFAVGRFRRAFVSYGFEDTDLGYRLYKRGLRFHLSKLVTLHLTPPPKNMNSGGSEYKRFLALSKTAKIFFLSNLDTEIYQHFINYMGGERDLIKESFYFFGKLLKRFSKEPKKSEALIR